MITSTELFKKTQQKYTEFVKSIIRQESWFPLELAVDKKPEGDLKTLRFQLQDLLNHSKSTQGFGFSMTLKPTNTQKYGLQDLPDRIWFENETDFLKYLGKINEIKQFRENLKKIKQNLSLSANWLEAHWKWVIEYAEDWDGLILVCHYFLQNPRPNLYIRELPIAVHTKFIETHQFILRKLLDELMPTSFQQGESEFEKRYGLKYREPLLRFSVLDEAMANTYFSGLNDMSIPIGAFAALKIPVEQVIIVENKTALDLFLTLPKLPKTMSIFGSGFGVTLLKSVAWLQDTPILYWGDVDAQGFEILAQLRSSFPKTKSFLMNELIFKQYKHFVQNGTETTIKMLPALTTEEYQLYKQLVETNQRLEQEKIEHQVVVEALFSLTNFGMN